MGKKTALGRIEGYGGPERRAHTRFNVEVGVQVAELGVLKGFLTRDVSEGGMLLATQHRRKIGSALAVTLIHPGTGDELPVITTVVRYVTDTDGNLLGLGLKFHQFDEALQRRLRLLLRDAASVGDVVEKVRDPNADPRAEAPAPPRPPAMQPPPSAQSAPIEMTPSEVIDIPEQTSGRPAPSIHMTAVPVLGALKEHLEPMLLHLVLNVNGRNSVEEITRKTGLRVSETLAGLGELLERGIVTIPEIHDTHRSPKPAEALDEAQVEEAATFATTRAEEYLKQADAAEKNGQTADAIRLLQLALTVGPSNPVPIHTRLARLALYNLLDVDLAEHHCTAGLAADSDAEPLRQLLEEIRSLQKETVGKRTREVDLDQLDGAPSSDRKGLGLLIFVGAVLVVVVLMVVTVLVIFRT